MTQAGTLLIIDYNLSRMADVARMVAHARERHGVRTLLVRSNPGARDFAICDEVIDLDPVRADFVDLALAQLAPRRDTLRGGVVFSDNAVHSGALLLDRLGLRVDCATLALGAFSKYAYRLAETHHRELLNAQRVLVPDCVSIASLAELQAFAEAHPDGFVLKPSCEGNNRGVIVVRAGDDLQAAFDEVAPYLAGGIICEQLIPYRREYSYDGIGALSFITEKVGATGRYPVEVAQVLPARLTAVEQHTLQRAGQLCNMLVGQRDGPFHNEIKLSDDGAQAAVVEPNRRPGGMKIWSLAGAVYGVDLYALWVDSVLGASPVPALLAPLRQAATVMLGVPCDGVFSPASLGDGTLLFEQALAATVAQHGLRPGQLRTGEFGWLSPDERLIHAVPRDNADFVAQATIVLDTVGAARHDGVQSADIRDIVATLRECWLAVQTAHHVLTAGHSGGITAPALEIAD